MIRFKIFGALASVFLVGLFESDICGQNDEARAVLESFLRLNAESKLLSPGARTFLTGEAAAWNEPSIGLIPGAPDRFIAVRPDYLAVRVTSTMPNGFERDFYFYLSRHESAWKVEAMRTLALTGVLDKVLEQLNGPNPPDDAADIRRNIELTLATDSALRSWFAEHRSDLMNLTRGLPKPEESALCKALGLTHIDHQGDTTTITIGGILDNSVGFLFSPTRAAPRIDPSEFIWVEDLGDRWYLFRTT